MKHLVSTSQRPKTDTQKTREKGTQWYYYIKSSNHKRKSKQKKQTALQEQPETEQQ